jgi:Raf kinase inhibitor-like YbhB/YbcL family protein
MAKEKGRLLLITALMLISSALMSGCESGASATDTPEAAAPAAALEPAAETTGFQITSAAFTAGDPIPVKYSCDGEDISPPLGWSAPPAGSQGFALIADDPDAPSGTWVHWVLYNVPADTHSLPEAIPPDADLIDGSHHGNNSWKRLGYGGPCPPGGTHRYFFKLYALDSMLNLEAGANKDRLLEAMEGHILAQTELMGTYTRQ